MPRRNRGHEQFRGRATAGWPGTHCIEVDPWPPKPKPGHEPEDDELAELNWTSRMPERAEQRRLDRRQRGIGSGQLPGFSARPSLLRKRPFR